MSRARIFFSGLFGCLQGSEQQTCLLLEVPMDLLIRILSYLDWKNRLKVEALSQRVRNRMWCSTLRKTGTINLNEATDNELYPPSRLIKSIVGGRKIIGGIIVKAVPDMRMNKALVDVVNIILSSNHQLKTLDLEGFKIPQDAASDGELSITSRSAMTSLEKLRIQSCHIQIELNCLNMNLKELHVLDSTNVSLNGLFMRAMNNLKTLAVDIDRKSCLRSYMIEEVVVGSSAAELSHLELGKANKNDVINIVEKLVANNRNLQSVKQLYLTKLVLKQNDVYVINWLLKIVSLEKLHICSAPSRLLAKLIWHAGDQLSELTVDRYSGYELGNAIYRILDGIPLPRMNNSLTVNVNNSYLAIKNAYIFEFGHNDVEFFNEYAISVMLESRFNITINYSETEIVSRALRKDYFSMNSDSCDSD